MESFEDSKRTGAYTEESIALPCPRWRVLGSVLRHDHPSPAQNEGLTLSGLVLADRAYPGWYNVLLFHKIGTVSQQVGRDVTVERAGV